MGHRFRRWGKALAAAAVIGSGVGVSLLDVKPAAAQAPVSPFRDVEPLKLPLDRAGVWTLNFAYIPPRIITVNEPGQGPRLAWYMLYQVWNTSDTPVSFVPEFELVTKDGELRTFADEPHPAVVKQIRTEEDKTGAMNIQTSISITKIKIPVTKADSIPRAVYGVAVWLDVPQKAPNVNNFSVYVTGLSNGLAVSESDKGPETISRKTLQIDFLRPTDNKRPKRDDIKNNENNGLGSEKWIYRVIPARTPAAAAPAPPAEKQP